MGKVKKIIIILACILLVGAAAGGIVGLIKFKKEKSPTTSAPIETADKGSYYLVGTMNDWKWSKDYCFEQMNVNPSEPTQIAQYFLTVQLDENTEVKICKGDGDYQYNHCTNYDCDYCVFSGSSNPTVITQTGTYTFYLKFYEDGGNSFYVAKVC